jgi:hypothetical protein
MAVRTSLASPAVLRNEFQDSSELVFAGQVFAADGTPVGGAVLELRGISLRADERGLFELLMDRPAPGPSTIEVRVWAPDHGATEHSIDALTAGRLSDGTLVVLHDFVLGAA